jgi:hypothetical protein
MSPASAIGTNNSVRIRSLLGVRVQFPHQRLVQLGDQIALQRGPQIHLAPRRGSELAAYLEKSISVIAPS